MSDLHETHTCRECGAVITMPYAQPGPPTTVDEAREALLAYYRTKHPTETGMERMLDALIAAVRAEEHNRTTFTTWQGVCGHLWNRAAEDTEDCPRCRERAESAEALRALQYAARNVVAAWKLPNMANAMAFDGLVEALRLVLDARAVAATPAEDGHEDSEADWQFRGTL